MSDDDDVIVQLEIYAFRWRRIRQNVFQISVEKDINLPDWLLTH